MGDIIRDTAQVLTPADSFILRTTCRAARTVIPVQEYPWYEMRLYAHELAQRGVDARDLLNGEIYAKLAQIGRDTCNPRNDAETNARWVVAQYVQSVLFGCAQFGSEEGCLFALTEYEKIPQEWEFSVTIEKAAKCAALGGHENICRFLFARCSTSRHFFLENMMSGAAIGGHITLCRLVYEWTSASTDVLMGVWRKHILEKMLIKSAKYGNEGLCRLAREWIFENESDRGGMASIYAKMLKAAATGGHSHIFHLAHEWSIEALQHQSPNTVICKIDYSNIAKVAAKNGHVNICHIICESAGGELECCSFARVARLCDMELCRKVRDCLRANARIPNYQDALNIVARAGHLELCATMREWMREDEVLPDYQEMALFSIKGHSVSAAALARKWAIEDGYEDVLVYSVWYNEALGIHCTRVREAIIAQVREWDRDADY